MLHKLMLYQSTAPVPTASTFYCIMSDNMLHYASFFGGARHIPDIKWD